METTSDTAPQRSSPRHESLRVIVALYFMLQAMGLLPDPAVRALFDAILPAPFASPAYAISIFAAAWLILVGRHVQRAALALIAITLLAALGRHLEPETWLRNAALLGGLIIIGGFFDRQPAPTPPSPGRVRLIRVAGKCVRKRTQRGARATDKAAAEHPFGQSPDDLNCLFDQIAEIR